MMAEFAFLMLPSQTLHPYNPYRRLRARPRRHLTMVWPPSFKEITTLARRHSRWIFQRLLQLKCPKSQAGRPSRWQARHQASHPSRVLCEKQLQHKPISSCLTLSCYCEIYVYLYISFFFFRKMAFYLFTDCQHIRMPSGALSACGWSLHHCTHRHCIHSYLHGVLFSRLTRAFD